MAAVPRVSRQDKFKLFNGLVCLAQGLEGKYTTVDLRNESCVTGKISQVDAQMNVVMSEAVFIDARGSEFPFDSFFIHARNIRYIHIPQQIEIVPTIKKQLQMLSNPRKFKNVPDAKAIWKNKRRQQKQQETLKMIQEYKEKMAKKKDKEDS